MADRFFIILKGNVVIYRSREQKEIQEEMKLRNWMVERAQHLDIKKDRVSLKEVSSGETAKTESELKKKIRGSRAIF